MHGSPLFHLLALHHHGLVRGRELELGGFLAYSLDLTQNRHDTLTPCSSVVDNVPRQRGSLSLAPFRDSKLAVGFSKAGLVEVTTSHWPPDP